MDLSLLDEEDEEETSSYRYSVCAVDDETKCYKGEYSATSGGKTTPIAVKCDPFDVYTMTVSQFDKDGNYNLGISEQLVFPEIDYESVEQRRGFNITIVTTAKTTYEGFFLLTELGVPFTKDNQLKRKET
jgi:hypothetical protein